MTSMLRCIACGRIYSRGTRFRCDCGDLLEVEHGLIDVTHETFDSRLGQADRPYNSGVWRSRVGV